MHAHVATESQPHWLACWKPSTLSPMPPTMSTSAGYVHRRRVALLHDLRPRDEDQGDDRDRHVDPEDRPPRPLAEVAAGDRARPRSARP